MRSGHVASARSASPAWAAAVANAVYHANGQANSGSAYPARSTSLILNRDNHLLENLRILEILHGEAAAFAQLQPCGSDGNNTGVTMR